MTTQFVVLLSGSLRSGGTCDRVARWCAEICEAHGATVRQFAGSDLQFPFYERGLSPGHPAVSDFLGALERADGIVLISPTYHGSISGLLKNALDYVNDLQYPRALLEGRHVGCVAVGAGAQGPVSTLTTLRTIAHSLRAWPTPLGVVVTGDSGFEAPEAAPVGHCERQLAGMLTQVLAPRSPAAVIPRPSLATQP